MKRRLRNAVDLLIRMLLAYPMALIGGASPRAMFEVALPAATGPVQDASVVFVSDQMIRVLLVPKNYNAKSTIAGFRIGAAGIVETGQVTVPGKEIFSGYDGSVFVRSGPRLRLYAPDLKTTSDIPISGGALGQFIATPFPLAGVLGVSDSQGWLAVRLNPAMPTVAQGKGYLLATSETAFLTHRADMLLVQDVSGKQLGAIHIAQDAHDRPTPGRKQTANRIAEFAGPGRVLLSYGDRDRIVDFTGKSVATLRSPPGWGFRHAWSADGQRLLYDHYAVPFSAVFRAIDNILSVLVPVPEEEQNREELTVMDAVSGSKCFRLQQYNRLAPLLIMHGDISPSGRLVAVVSAEKLFIYDLPANCRVQ